MRQTLGHWPDDALTIFKQILFDLIDFKIKEKISSLLEGFKYSSYAPTVYK